MGLRRLPAPRSPGRRDVRPGVGDARIPPAEGPLVRQIACQVLLVATVAAFVIWLALYTRPA